MAFGNDEPVRTDAFRATDECAEIVRIGDTVRDDDERCLAAFFCDPEDVLHLAVFLFRRHGDDALVRREAGKAVQFCAFHLDDGNSASDRFRDKHGDGAGPFPALNQNLVNRPLALQEFPDRVTPDDRAVFVISVDTGIVRSDIFRLFSDRKRLVKLFREGGGHVFVLCPLGAVGTIRFLSVCGMCSVRLAVGGAGRLSSLI